LNSGPWVARPWAPFINTWVASTMFCYEQSFCEHRCTDTCLSPCFSYSGYIFSSRTFGLYGNFIFWCFGHREKDEKSLRNFFLLMYINCIKEFIVIFPYLYIMYFDQIYPLYYSYLSPLTPPLKTILMGFIILFSYMHMKYAWSYSPPIIFLIN
jgi:hypothetical protein